MRRIHKTKKSNKQLFISDPASRRCALALLRIIATCPQTLPDESSNIACLLASLVTEEELVGSFTPSGQAQHISKALADKTDDEDDIFGEFSEELKLLSRTKTDGLRTSGVKPTPSVIRAIGQAEPAALSHLAQVILRNFDSQSANFDDDWISGNALILKGLFELSAVETDIAALALALGTMKGQGDLVARCVEDGFFNRSARKATTLKLAAATAYTVEQLAVIFSPAGALRSSGILRNLSVISYDIDDVLALSELGQLFASEPFESEAAVRERVLTPVSVVNNPFLVLTHLGQQRKDIGGLLNGTMCSGEPGVNVLLYGAPGTGKTEFARQLAADVGANLYEVGYTSESSGMDASRDDRLSYLKLANRLILPEERAVILLDEAEDIFDTLPAEDQRGKSPRRGSKAWMNALLEKMRIPTIWITNDIQIDPAHIRRFAYTSAIDIPPLSVRRAIVRSHTESLGIRDKSVDLLARDEHLSPAILGTAARFIRLSNVDPSGIDEALIRHVNASHRAMRIQQSESIIESGTVYDPRFVNLDSLVSVEALTSGLKRSGRASLLFSGPSGTGKTQFANYLATQLDRQLVYKTGSDLLSKYVGDTEQKIATLFRNCDVEREIIFLDEAEGLLASRESAARSWEITQVNEFLRRIEQFKGIFIAATNHRENLDGALMRRFAFRLDFKPMTFEQRLAMFESVAGIRLREADAGYQRLKELDTLTAGHFANVDRRLQMLGTSDKDAWLGELVVEADSRSETRRRRVGFA